MRMRWRARAVMMTAPWMVQRTRKDSESGVWAKSVVSEGTQGGGTQTTGATHGKMPAA